jgi:hypothetical protein
MAKARWKVFQTGYQIDESPVQGVSAPRDLTITWRPMEIAGRTVTISPAVGLTAPSRKVLQSSTRWARRDRRRGQSEPHRHALWYRDPRSWRAPSFGLFAKTECARGIGSRLIRVVP